MKTHGILRLGVAPLAAALLLAALAGRADALQIEYDIDPGHAGIWINSGSSIFFVTRNLEGSILFETDAPVAAGNTAAVLDLALVGTGRLCAACEVIGFEIQHDPSRPSVLDLIDDPLQPGSLATDGDLHMIWTLTGSFGSVDLAVTASTLFFGVRNNFSEDFFGSVYRVQSVEPIGQLPEGLDLSNLERFKLRGPGAVVVPEPTGGLLVGVGLLGIGALWARGRRLR